MQKILATHMVKGPYVANPEMKVQEALDFMRKLGIRHLPITHEGKIQGLVSERDLLATVGLPQGGNIPVSDVMSRELYIAQKSTPLKEVVRSMASDKIGSVLVVNDSLECIGIFTTIDALEVLYNLLDEDEDESKVLYFEDYVDFFDRPRGVSL